MHIVNMLRSIAVLGTVPTIIECNANLRNNGFALNN